MAASLGVAGREPAWGEEPEAGNVSMSQLNTPQEWLNTVYKHSAEKNVLAALNPKVFFGYFAVCADGQGFGYAHTYPSLDGHQLTHALLFLGRVEEALANWDYVKRWQKPNGQLPIRIDSQGEGLYVHWVPGDPLRTLGATTLAHNAYALYTHTLDDDWLRANLSCINLSASFLESFVTPEGRVGGAGYYIEVPTRIEWDGVSQCYAVDAFQKTALLNAVLGEEKQRTHWSDLAERNRANFQREYWRGDHCVEYIHPERGPVDKHGLTDVDWAAIATGILPKEHEKTLWTRVQNEPRFRYGGMPTGISTAPETYEDWEFYPADQFPEADHRHDLAAMGRVWYLEAWARWKEKDIAGLLDSLKAVAAAGKPNGYFWQERYFPSTEGLKPGGPLTYCEYPANLIRIVNQFLFGLELGVDGTLAIAPQLPQGWWDTGWDATIKVGAGTLTLHGKQNLLKGSWEDKVARKLIFCPPAGRVWKENVFSGDKTPLVEGGSAACLTSPGSLLEFELKLG